MIQLTKLTAKHIHILDDEDNEIMVDREHFESMYCDISSTIYWDTMRHINNSQFQHDMHQYIQNHHDIDYISNIQNELT